jgi:hypothetical protein
MVFWDTFPLLDIIKLKFNKDLFKSLVFNRDNIKSPTGVEAIIINKNQNHKFLSDVQKFIKLNFGEPPKNPILDIPIEYLLDNEDHIIFVKDIDKNIVGCIRYHFIGYFKNSNNERIYCVDCFTINKNWRKKGIGSYLLSTLHNYANKNNIPFALFLKEGFRLSVILSPIYTGVYVYRKLYMLSSKNVKSLTNIQAYNLMDIYFEVDPNTFIIRNIKNTNQYWKLYKRDSYHILVCFQDTFQRFGDEGKIKKICWATGWLESSNVTDNIREEASRELSAMMYPEFDYVWMNKMWVGNDKIWIEDGFFNWYLYQWTTSISIKTSYCILN